MEFQFLKHTFYLFLKKSNNFKNLYEKSPQRVDNPEDWLEQQTSESTQPIFPKSAQNLISQVENKNQQFYTQFITVTNQLDVYDISKQGLN